MAMIILNVDPGGYCPWIARLLSGRSWSLMRPFHSSDLIPRAKTFGSKAGELASTINHERPHYVVERTEQALLARYPEHRTVVKTIGWIQRIAVGSALAYHLSAAHYRQAATNTRLAREYGYR